MSTNSEHPQRVVANVKTGLSGWFKLEATDAITGKTRVVADWFPNLILDSGLELLGTMNNASQACAACQVGTSSTAVNASQTGLIARIAGTTTQEANTHGLDTSGDDYFGWSRRRYRFGQGVAEGNLSEVAVAPATTGDTFNRALILVGGVPTTITILATEFLDVTYELRAYPPMDDVEESVTISGQAHDIIIRAFMSTESWQPLTTFGATTSAWWYTGPIGTLTTAPSGTVYNSPSQNFWSTAPYSSNSGYLQSTNTLGLNAGNIGGIQSVLLNLGQPGSGGRRIYGAFQIQFDPVIDKDNTNVFTLITRNHWTRRTL